MKPTSGARIRVRLKHWARPGALGTIIKQGKHWGWLIRFDKKGVGINGYDMYLDELEFTILDPIDKVEPKAKKQKKPPKE